MKPAPGVQSQLRVTAPVIWLVRVPVRLVTGTRAAPATTILTGTVRVPTLGLEVKVTTAESRVPTAKPAALKLAGTLTLLEGATVPVRVGIANQLWLALLQLPMEAVHVSDPQPALVTVKAPL